MAWWLEGLSWVDEGGDVSWMFINREDGGRTVRARIRVSARECVIQAASRYLHGDWTPALIAYGVVAATAWTQPGDCPAWVTRENFKQTDAMVEQHRQSGVPLFANGCVEQDLQFGSPFGEGRISPTADACKGGVLSWSR